ncbi:MAG: polysaccharide biosynthesis/export family protein, partial [Pseudomonadota bacterium]
MKLVRLPPKLLIALLSVCFFGKASVSAEVYRLGLGDVLKVEILIMENQDLGEGKEINLQSSNIRIGPDGRVSVPLVGSVLAKNLTIDELADSVTRKLRVEIPVALKPYVTISVGSYRPVSILGAVKSPGSYEFTPGMTVRELLARSGGLNIFEVSEVPTVRVIDTLA